MPLMRMCILLLFSGLFYTCLLALVDLLCVDIFCFLVDLLFSVLSIVEGRY